MSEILIRLIMTFVKTILTQKVFNKFIVQGLWALAQKSENRLDDSLVKAVAEALGVALPKK